MRHAPFALSAFSVALGMIAVGQGCSSATNSGSAGDHTPSAGDAGVSASSGGSSDDSGVTASGSSGGGSGGQSSASSGSNGGSSNSSGDSGGSSGSPGGSSGSAGGSSDAGFTSADGGLPLSYGTENTGADCPKPTMPAFGALTPVANLPDPFLMSSGSRITSRSDWRCRRAEIAAAIQSWETGTKPAPPSNLTATYSGGMLSVTVTQGANSITLSTTITLPSGAGPFPAIIGMDTGGTGSLPSNIFTSRNIATMTFSSSQLTPQLPGRGQGAIFSLYPDATAGSMILWAWGVSRIIDGLEKTAPQTHIDMSRLAVTGCSYAGKMALYAGAFDERIALTIPEESGGGGEAAWRVSATMTGTEDLEHAQGTAWYSSNLAQFKNADAPKLPFDQHELAAMVAPRALLTIGNPDIAYLASESGYVSMKAATEVYKALGVPDRVGFSQVGGHSHCAFPTSQSADVAAFVDKFLVGNTSANTSIAKSPYTTDLTKWITWSTPQLQ
jgi:hypothetical protein